ncbi:MAG: hypothetical protein RIC55_12385 [Pirellulaceae bacterium]
MWSRVVEVMLGCWLVVSPFVFRYADNATWLWGGTFATATVVILLALSSYWRPMRHAHLATFAVAAGMILVGRFLPADAPPLAYQNFIYVGVLLLMFSLVPNDASRPPRSWKEAPATSN